MYTADAFDEGLFILDTRHLPWGCAVWPGFWTTNEATWPADGEIDIVEEIHNSPFTMHTLHTRDQCDFSSVNTDGQFTGSWGSNKNCFHEINGNQGCGIQAPDGSYGEKWSNEGGGVHITLLDRNKGNFPDRFQIIFW